MNKIEQEDKVALRDLPWVREYPIPQRPKRRYKEDERNEDDPQGAPMTLLQGMARGRCAQIINAARKGP